MRREEALNAGRIERVTITLDWEMIAWFKAQTEEDWGTRWLELVERALQFLGPPQAMAPNLR